MRPGILAVVLVVLVVLHPSTSVGGDDYFPLQTGRNWTFYSENAEPFGTWLEMQVLGRVDFHGLRDVHVAWDLGLMEPLYLYLHKTELGDMGLHGTQVGGDVEVYVPPRPLLDVPLTPGKTWEYTGQVLYYVDDVLTEQYGVAGSYEVIGPETVTVPAGTFEAMGVVETFFGAMPGLMSIPWPHVPVVPSKAPDTFWYAQSVGWVILDSTPYYELDSYSVPVTARSWGSVKALYGSER